MKRLSIVGAAFLIASGAPASVTSLIGPVDSLLYYQQNPPTTVEVATNYGIGNMAAVWNDQQCFALTAAVSADMTSNPGTFSAGGAPGSLLPNVEFDVHMIHYYADTAEPITATMRFDGRIEGVVFTKANLDATDTCAPTGTTYTTWTGRGMDTAGGDDVSVNGNKLTFTLNPSAANAFTAEIRVFTKRSPPGDYNGDTFAGAADWAKFLAEWNNGVVWSDVNGDGFVDGIDYNMWFEGELPPPC